jgi:hypothetical protein
MAQGILGKINNAIKKDSASSVINQIVKQVETTSKGSALSEEEIINGLKEALTIGTNNSTKKLGVENGFFNDAIFKIAMPPEAQKVASSLRRLGMGSLVDKAELSMNRAAEDATSGVADIFIEAIKKMTIKDGLEILKGDSVAATNYLKTNTSQQLTEKIKPVIEASLKKVNATKYWSDVFKNYNKFLRQNVNTDLTAYVSGKTSDAIFYSISQEENKIRKDPAAQVTDLLKKVFGK